MTDKITVLFDQRVIPNYRLGIYRKLSAIPDLSFRVSYWSDRFLDDTPHVSGDLGFETVAFTPQRWRIRGRVHWFNSDLVRYIARSKLDVVVGSTTMFASHPLLSKLIEEAVGRLVGTGFVYRVSFGLLPGVEPRVSPGGARGFWYRWLYRNVVVTAYNQRAAEIALCQGCRPDRILVDYNSMDSDELFAIRGQLEQTIQVWKPEFLAKYGLNRQGYVLFAGRISPDKRLDLLIAAWTQVSSIIQDAQLVVVGSGPGKQEAIRQSRNLADHIVFVDGVYDDEELAKFYHLADLVVFPGYSTLSTHFAMCFAKPIITSQYGNEAEYTTHGINGLVYDYGNAEDLAAKMVILLTNESLRMQYGKESEYIVKTKINGAHMIETIHAAIKLADQARYAVRGDLRNA